MTKRQVFFFISIFLFVIDCTYRVQIQFDKWNKNRCAFENACALSSTNTVCGGIHMQHLLLYNRNLKLSFSFVFFLSFSHSLGRSICSFISNRLNTRLIVRVPFELWRQLYNVEVCSLTFSGGWQPIKFIKNQPLCCCFLVSRFVDTLSYLRTHTHTNNFMSLFIVER